MGTTSPVSEYESAGAEKGYDMSIGRFCAGIAALLWSPPNGKYLLLKRSEDRDVERR